MANAITAVRALLSLMLLFCPTMSPLFYAVYFFAGITDIFDGCIARKTGSDSELGAKLDTAADFVFVCICLFKFLPVLAMPEWIY